MHGDRPRIAAILLFAAAAVLVGVGNSTHERWLTVLAIVCFVLGAAAFLRWRRAQRARVLDPKDKTGEGGSP